MVLVEKPEELRHGGAPIYSISCSPCGERLATVGGDQRVKVWGVGEVVQGLKRAARRRRAAAGPGGGGSEAHKEGAGGGREPAPAPKLLATLASHAAPVNCAAFSQNGRWLATGADDHLVQVHELRPGEAPHASDFGSGDQHSLEHWAKWLTFSGHQNNVTDLAWSPDDSMVASCSLDNTGRVWRVGRASQVAVFEDHNSFVKGVVWDPLGKYLASQSDDKSVVVWAIDGWQRVARVEEPFRKALDNTFSTRLAWSPDGSSLTAMNAYQPIVERRRAGEEGDKKRRGGEGAARDWRHTAAVLSRGSWERSHDFVGHRAPVVAASFNPHLFRPSPAPGS